MNISFARKILNKKINLDKADEDRVQLLIQIMDFKMNTKPQNHEKKNFKKKKTLQSEFVLFDSSEMVYKSFKSETFTIIPNESMRYVSL